MRILNGLWLLCMAFSLASAADRPLVGKVSYVEGEAFVERGAKATRLSVSAKLKAGDLVRTGSESILEITLASGSVLRFAENARGVLQEGSGNGAVEMREGKLWANIQKIKQGGFSVSTPVATAAVRGTIFRVENSDSAGTSVALYEGIVDVGPADSTRIKASVPAAGGWGPPVQVPGPFEVSLEEWVRLKPGKQIQVRNGGKYATGDIDASIDTSDKWVRFNQQRDAGLSR